MLFAIMIDMSRPIRVEYSNALYHVITRGNAFQDIYLDDKDRKKFLDWLRKAVETYHLICHAYCLMDNHYHLLIETPDANLSKAMRDLNGNYTQWFNARHRRIGHLFQGRYKAFVIEKESYLLGVSRYIILNPVRAKLVSHPRFWKWSSYRATVGSVCCPDWLSINWMLSLFSKSKNKAQKEYHRFISEGTCVEDPYRDLTHRFILGTPQFVHWIWKKTKSSEHIKEHSREERIVGKPNLQELFEDISTKNERNEAIVFARFLCGYSASEIARFLHLDRSVVSKISRGVYKKIKKARSTT
ncbi:MAG: hypothetical protein UX57_C0009G0031 [Candidatus Uhrbacteria bacterium GW2011_GWE2_46_68]|uniref:Transposase IS200-like domain-containing protein n=2 Tax=Candidatus Uhriibacteriota TaxID=1752732 RepID=A0A0G1Q782_9BACT|nr:MAG: hypothetical protein UX45_C0006G0031 [Candidatus Uhrbacteria bacterium GW2011_GWF2_46_218]KKU40864.1 MAG: hypothetical protein UX57_C0009G0031 [Candidatus Uhrbacteria bacterium GW2011_GWE2_46_68]